MAKYTEKSEADLAWDKIRREVQYRINLAASHWRAEMQNKVLPALQEEFESHLNRGVLLELETGAQGFVDELVEAALADATRG